MHTFAVWANFITQSEISSHSDLIYESGFIPTKADLVKKSHDCEQS